MNSSLFTRFNILRHGGSHRLTRDIKEFYDTATKPGQPPFAGRAWSASELRLKSFSDLHKLWFVLLKEKNMLLSERLHARSTHEQTWKYPMRLKKVKLGMARIKVVLGERARAYQEARKELRKLYVDARREEIAARKAENLRLHTQRILTQQAEKIARQIREQELLAANSDASNAASSTTQNIAQTENVNSNPSL